MKKLFVFSVLLIAFWGGSACAETRMAEIVLPMDCSDSLVNLSPCVAAVSNGGYVIQSKSEAFTCDLNLKLMQPPSTVASMKYLVIKADSKGVTSCRMLIWEKGRPYGGNQFGKCH